MLPLAAHGRAGKGRGLLRTWMKTKEVAVMLEIATNDEKNTKEAYSETALMRAKEAAARLLQVGTPPLVCNGAKNRLCVLGRRYAGTA